MGTALTATSVEIGTSLRSLISITFLYFHIRALSAPFKVSDTAVYMHEIDDGFFEPEPELEDVQVAQGRVDVEEEVEEMARELEQA